MNRNYKIVKINSIFKTLLLKNIISVFFIGLICFSASYIYNLQLKKIIYDYSITIQPVNIWITEKSVIERDDLAPQNFLSFFLQNYVSKLPGTTGDKRVSIKEEDNEFNVTFKSYDNPVDVSNFMQVLNDEAKQAVLMNMKNKYNTLFRKSKLQKEFDLENVAKKLKNFPEIYQIQKLEQAIQNKLDLEEQSLLLLANLNELNYLINNFDELFASNMYYSLNGWQIKNNIYNIAEVLVAGLLFWFLLTSFFLFFRSNYFQKKLSN